MALDWHRSGRGAVLAKVIEARGSALHKAGSQMMGSVAGDCVEAAMVAEAAEVMATGLPKLPTYGDSHDDAFAAGWPVAERSG